jgi:hypothetical protein
VILTIACLAAVHIASIYVLLHYVLLHLGQFLFHIRVNLDTEALQITATLLFSILIQFAL